MQREQHRQRCGAKRAGDSEALGQAVWGSEEEQEKEGGWKEVKRRTREDSGRTPRVKGPKLWSSGQLEAEELTGIFLLRGKVTNVCF